MNPILEKMHYYMQLTRTFDQKAINLQRTGRLGTFPSSLGQEAWFVGLGLAMADNDIYCPYYRDQGALFARGANLARMFCYWGGLEIGNDLLYDYKDMPISVPIASQTTYACGLAYAAKLKQADQVIICSLGDGATSKGDFHEAMNMAGIHKLPIIFVINNNAYAISTPLIEQTSNTKLEDKGLSHDIPGYTVAGNDIVAVYNLLQQLRPKCLADGPLIIVGKTYRLHDHTTADDAKRYIDQEYLNLGQKLDPIDLIASKITQETIAKTVLETKALVAAAADEYLNTYDDTNALDYVFAKEHDK